MTRRAAILWLLGGALFLTLMGRLLSGTSPPVGRTSRSVTRVGHKAVYLLTQKLGYQVARFERGLESLAQLGPGVLVALEPGNLLFREHGRYAGGLTRWLEAGNAAIVTLGRDPDRAAERDDQAQAFGASGSRAVEQIRQVQAELQRGRTSTTSVSVARVARFDPDAAWGAGQLAGWLELSLDDGRLPLAQGATVALSGPFSEVVGSFSLTRPRTWRYEKGTPLLIADGQPLALELSVGRGRLYLVAEPRFFHNGAIGRAGHARFWALLLQRAAEHSGGKSVWFEEFSHGYRNNATILDLAFKTEARWLLFQISLIGLAWMWMVGSRRRSVVPLPVAPRRSKDETVEALASLALRGGDTAGAWARLSALTRSRLAASLGLLEQQTNEELVRAVAQALGEPEASVRALLESPVANDRALVARADALLALRQKALRAGLPKGAQPGNQKRQ